MPDSLGPVPIPDPVVIAPFPVRVDYGGGMDIADRVVGHLFDQPGLRTEQRFYLGDGARRFRVHKDVITCGEYDDLKSHWLDAQGVYAEFDYDHPTGRDSFDTFRVRYGDPTLGFSHAVDMLTGDPGLLLIEVPQTTPDLTAAAVLERFPDTGFSDALLEQVQSIIPLIRIQPHGEPGAAPPDDAPPAPIYISDRRCNLIAPDDAGGTATTLYLPRLLEWGGISQSLGENSDSAQLTFGNADRVWFDYVNRIELNLANVDFWLFFENSNVLLKLWSGYIQSAKFNENENLELAAVDGIYELNLAYPVRQVSRSCWKIFADGVWCPYSDSHIDPDTGTAKPGFTDCGKSWDDCRARGMTRHFGGIQALAETVHPAKPGLFNVDLSQFTSATLRNDSVYGIVMQEVYNDTDRLQLPAEAYLRPKAPPVLDGPDWQPAVPKVMLGKPLPVNCAVAMGRDEKEFYAAIGIVGEGPITQYGTNIKDYLLDKRFPADVDNPPRAVTGRDPIAGFAESVEFFAINRLPWTWPSPWSPAAKYPPEATFAAGTAFVEIRRVDETGIQAASVTDREMTIPVEKGIGGWAWTAPGAREWKAPLTNPVWVAINCYLKALGLKADNNHTSGITIGMQEARFDVDAAVAAAAVCDEQVPLIIGAISPDQRELQFTFRGIISEQKPLRDWLQEILNGCLGYYTFRNGKLKLGIRFHSGVAPAGTFTIANILHRSLQAEPVMAQFNWLSGEFGDEEYSWQTNRVVIYDIDHARAYGNAVAPRYTQSNMTFVGINTKSQAARIVTTRLREELGGATRTEQRNARNISFRTTVMALGVDPGTICSLTHTRMPNTDHRVEFRVQSWKLNPDWSLDISGSSTCDHMYDWVFGHKPEDAVALPVPGELFDTPLNMAWLPNEIAPFPDDPVLDPTELSFALRQVYPIEAEGTYSPAVVVRGEMPLTKSLSGDSPVVRKIDYSSTGGFLPGGRSYFFVVGQRNEKVPVPPDDPIGGEFSPLSNYVGIWVPYGTDTNKVTLSSIRWPQAMPGYGLWAGNNVRVMSQQIDDPGTPLPEEITIMGPLTVRTRGAPNPDAKRVRIKAREVYHSGVAGIQVQEVIAPNQIRSNELTGSDDPWVGQLLAVIADASDFDVPLWNFTITAFDPASGTFTVTPDCVGVPGPGGTTDAVEEGDVMIVRSRPTSWTASDPTDPTAIDTLVNTLWVNDVGTSQFHAVDGLIPGFEAGLTLIVIAGKGKGQVRQIISNTETSHTVKPAFSYDFAGNLQIDETSVYLITRSDWPYAGESNVLNISAENQRAEIVVRITNSTDQTMLIGGFLVDRFDRETREELACFREIYVFGEPYHVRTATEDSGTGLVETSLLDQTLRVDTTAGDQTVELLPVENYFGRKLLVVNDGTGSTPGRVIVQPTAGEEYQSGATEIILDSPGDWAEFVAAGDREETRVAPSALAGRRRSQIWSRRKRALKGTKEPLNPQLRRKGLQAPPDRKGQI